MYRKIIFFLWRFAYATRLVAVFGLKKAPAVLPDDFDWKFYLDYYPDLRRAGLRTEQDAAEHYLWRGFLEKRFTCAPEQELVNRHEDVRRRQLKNIVLFNDQHVEIVRNKSAPAPVTVSVVITLYNYAQYIEACLRSVVNSTYKDVEIIVVNDASTDDSLELCRTFPASGIALTIIDKKINTGLVQCRNLGIQHARGEYVFILDADNEIYPDCLAKHVACMRADKGRVACYGVIDIFDEAGRFFTQVSSDPFDYVKLLRGNYIDAMALFDRRTLIDIGMYNETLLEQGIGYEDYELWLRIGQQGHAVGFIERSLSRYLKKHDSMLAVADRYYRASLMRWIRQQYRPDAGPPGRTAVLVVGMHRSGTSALAGMLSLMGAYPGPDLIGPDRSNQKGHFEPRKIVAVNDALLESLGARGPDSEDLPADWLERDETRRAAEQLRRIIAEDYCARDIFVIKDPRLCLVLPLYLKIFSQMDIDVRIIVIERDMREVLKSLHARGGAPYSRCRMFYEKHIRALQRNLSGQSYCGLTFNQLVQEPGIVIEKIRACIPRLAAGYSRDMDRQIEKFIDPDLRHHCLSSTRGVSSVVTIISRACDHLSGRAGGPDFLVIGAQRAGTTTLYHYLCGHPRIQAPAAKELHWFHAGPKESDGYHNGHQSRQWYERQLAGKGRLVRGRLLHRNKLTFEATPEYLCHPAIPQKVSLLYPAAKIIVLLRDPLERAVSQYYHEKNNGFIEADLSIEDYFARDRRIAADEEPKLLRDPEYFSYVYEHCCPIARSNYGRQLGRWLRCFPSERMLILRSEDLFHDPGSVMHVVFNFLGISCCAGSSTITPVMSNSSNRPQLSDGQRAQLLSFFPYDMSVEKFCTPRTVDI